MSNDIATIQELSVAVGIPADEIETLEAAMERYGNAALVDMAPAKRALHVASAMNALDAALTPKVMGTIMPLMNSRCGFKTDRDPKNKDKQGNPLRPYPVAVVKECLKEAILYGVFPTGNEMNIIASGMYITKEGLSRKLSELQGMTDLVITIGVPKMNGSTAYVNCKAKWKMNGKVQTIGIDTDDPCNIPIRVNNFMGDDAILGKADRKLKKRIWDRATGTTISLPEGEAETFDASGLPDATVTSKTPRTSDLADALEKRGNPEPTPTPEAEAELSDEELQAKLEAKREAARTKDETVTPDAPPKAYNRLSRAYDVHPKKVDAALSEVGLPALFDIDWKILSEKGEALLKRAAAKYAKTISEGK